MLNHINYLNKTIHEHIDILWQEEWYDFYDIAMELADMIDNTRNTVLFRFSDTLRIKLNGAGDQPSQEQWYDICDAVCQLTIALYENDYIPGSALDAYPDLYQ